MREHMRQMGQHLRDMSDNVEGANLKAQAYMNAVRAEYGNDYVARTAQAAVDEYNNPPEGAREAARRDRADALVRADDEAKSRAYKNPHGDKVGIGTILTSSWGYDQTNVDFYEVTGMSKSGKTVTLRGLAKIKTYEGDMTGRARAIPGKYDDDKPITKKLQPGGRVRLTSYAGAGIWNGEDKYFSEYA
jgi:hypothetical protein